MTESDAITMTPDQFERSLQTFGADLERWPVGSRREARALLARSADHREAWKQTGEVDRLLRRDGEGAVMSARMQTIADGALRRIRQQEPTAPAWRWLLTGPVCAAFASSAFAGVFAMVLVGPIFDPPRPPGVSLVAYMLIGGGRGANELF